MTAAEEICRQIEQASDDAKASLRAEWEQACGHTLSEDEYLEIESNLAAFFELLWEWELADHSESGDNGDDALKDEGECT